MGWSGVKNKWKVQFYHLKHRFLDFNQFANWADQEAKNEFKAAFNSETTLYQLHPSRILGWSRGRKWYRNAYRTLETSLSQSHPCRILCSSCDRKWVQSDMPAHGSSLSRPHPSHILLSSRAEIEFLVPGGHLKHRFLDLTQVGFRLVKRLKMSSQCLASTWNITFSISHNSHFGLEKMKKWVQRAIRKFEWSLFSTSSKSHFLLHFLLLNEAENVFQVQCKTLKYHFFDLKEAAFWAVEEEKMSSHCVVTSSKHRCVALTQVAFGLVKGQKMVSKWHGSIWNIAVSNSSNFGWSGGRK